MECGDACYYLCSYLDGELDLERAGILEEHLRSCSACKRELRLQQFVKSLLQQRLLKSTVPDSLRNRVIFELGRVEEYRDSGIQPLDLILWGTHIAQFYNKRSDMTEVLVSYMERGLKENELCMWITAEISEVEAREALAKKVPGLQEYVDKKQLQFFSYKDWYLSDGYFDAGKVLNAALSKCEEALSRGYLGFRAAGNISWLEQSDWSSFMEYESRLDNVIPDQKALVTCVYKEDQCTKNNVVDVMDRHKYVISRIGDSWQLRRSSDVV